MASDSSSSLLTTLVAALAVGICFLAFHLFGNSPRPKTKQTESQQAEQPKQKPKQGKKDITAAYKSQHKSSKPTSADGTGTPKEETKDHELLSRHLRGHQGDITGVGFSGDGKHIVSCSKDQSVRVWSINEGEKNTPFVRVNTKGEFATACSFSHDSKYIVLAMAESREIQFFGVKTHDGKINVTFLHKFPTQHKQDITTVLLAPNNSFVLTCAKGQDTNLFLYTPKGQLIHTLNTSQLVNYNAAISPDSRFIGAATKLADVKIWEVIPSKTGGVEKVELVMTLKKGHQKAVHCLSFGANGETAGTASVDGRWILWDLKVQYKLREDPKIRHSVQTDAASCDVIAVSPGSNAKTVAVSAGNTLMFYQINTGKLLSSIPCAHRGDITGMSFNSDGTRLATIGIGKTINVWNVPSGSS